MSETREYRTFTEFYPYYLEEHRNRACRRLHFIGTMLVITIFIYSIITASFMYLLLLPVAGYSFAWIGHYFFEKNRPATFTYPFYSLAGDFAMFRDILTGKIKF